MKLFALKLAILSGVAVALTGCSKSATTPGSNEVSPAQPAKRPSMK